MSLDKSLVWSTSILESIIKLSTLTKDFVFLESIVPCSIWLISVSNVSVSYLLRPCPSSIELSLSANFSLLVL